MAVNVEILGLNAAGIPLPHSDDLKHTRTVNDDAELIVKDILLDIFDKAVQKSEDKQQKILEEKNYCTESIDLETSDLIDLTRNYKQEFRTILQNLKCHSRKSQPSSNSSLEDQIKKVIDEIKSLETSVRLNSHQEGRGDIDIMSDENLSSNSNQIDYKSGITDFLNDCTNGKTPQDVYTDEDLNDEIVLRVIDLQPSTSEVSFTNQFPSEEDLEDVNLIDLNQGDRPQALVITNMLPNVEPCAGETAVANPVPEPEPNEKLLHTEDGVRKKKSLGRRLWHFIKKRNTASTKKGNNDSTL